MLQDVVDAARQSERARRSEQKKSKHVLYRGDLKRVSDSHAGGSAQIDARKNQAAPDLEEKSQDALDAKVAFSDVPSWRCGPRFRLKSFSLRGRHIAKRDVGRKRLASRASCVFLRGSGGLIFPGLDRADLRRENLTRFRSSSV